MSSLDLKIFAVILLIIGEGIAIYAEMLTARANYSTSISFYKIFLKMFLLMMMAGALLILGYALGFKAFQNIWIVSAVSITSILIIEPILAYTIFKQLPTTGALIGLILGAIGFIFAIFL